MTPVLIFIASVLALYSKSLQDNWRPFADEYSSEVEILGHVLFWIAVLVYARRSQAAPAGKDTESTTR